MSQSQYMEIRVIKADYLQQPGDEDAVTKYAYCVVECGKEKAQTHTVQNAISPRWDQRFHFGKGGKLSRRDNCRITVIETKGNTTIGTVTLNIGDLIGQARQIQTLSLEGHPRGRLQVETMTSTNPNGVIMQGQLKKEGGSLGGRTNWKNRWFVLYEDRFVYYENQKAFLASANPKGTVTLDCYYCSPTENEDSYEFTVMAYPRSMTLAATSKVSMNEWICCINSHIQNFDAMRNGKNRATPTMAEAPGYSLR